MTSAAPEPENTNSCSCGAAAWSRSRRPWRTRARSGARGRHRGGEKGLIAPILVGPAAKIREIAQANGIDLGQTRDRRRAAQPCRGGEGGGAGSTGRGRAADEGQPAHRRAAGRGRRARDRPAHRTAHQPRLHHGRADLPQGADRHRRGDQHRADARGQGRHLPERDRSRDLARRASSRRWRSSRRSRRSPRRCRRRSTPRALCKMADRGQITGGLLDGPLAFDNAISKEAAKIKGITSEVAGDPDILLVPDLEAGNILAKQLSFLANADSAGLVLGARVPIILTSRADSVRSRIASCARGDAGGARAAPDSCRRADCSARMSNPRHMDDYALVLNAGSSSLKFCVYRRPDATRLALEARGQIEGIGTSPRFSAKDGAGARARRRALGRVGAGRTRGARGARRLAALALRRRARARRRPSRRPRRRPVRRARRS